MQVELLNNGGYDGVTPCIGKVFTAKPYKHGYNLSVSELKQAGFEDFMIKSTLFFTPDEVRVLDDN